MAKVKAIPEGLHSVTPQLVVEGAAEAVEFYKRAFGAEELPGRAMDPSGKRIWHTALRIGDSTIFLNDAMQEMGGPAPSPVTLWIYGEEVDALFKRATGAGAKVSMPLTDMFWGDRTGTVTDPWGNRWLLAQHIKDMSPQEMKRAQDEWLAKSKE
jgi:uncharacterized glyoxalase superfamily protein PhnB